MLDRFLEFLKEHLPQVTPKSLKGLQATIRDQGFSPDWLYEPSSADTRPWQGDIVGPMPFLVIAQNGRPERADLPGLLLSNTCDMDRDDGTALVAQVMPAEDLLAGFDDDTRRDTKSNAITSLLFLPQADGGKDFVADLSIVQSVELGFLRNGLQSGSCRRVLRLSQKGYYLLLAKLTIHLLRVETNEIARS